MSVSLVSIVLIGTVSQLSAAAVAGTVRDADTGRPLAGAEVLLGDLGLGTLAGDGGRYEVRSVPPGPQHLTIRALGYESRTIHALVPVTGTLRLDVALVARPIPLEGLDVVGPVDFGPSTPDALGPSTDRKVRVHAIRRHPLLAEPDAFQALGGGGVYADPESPFGLHVRGGDTNQVAYLLDGIPVLNPVHSAGLFSAWNVDALSDVSLSSSSPSPALGPALSGVVSGTVRDPGPRVGTAASLSSTHGGVTVHGPVGGSPVGFVASIRSGFPGGLPARGEVSYLNGESRDGLLRVNAPVAQGTLAVLSYASDNEILSGVVAPAGPTAGSGFEWTDRSVGAVWRRGGPRAELELKAWRSGAEAGADWRGPTSDVRLRSSHVQSGIQVTRTGSSEAAADQIGARILRVRATYGAGGAAYDASMKVMGVFAERRRSLGRGWHARAGANVEVTSTDAVLAPGVELTWRSPDRWLVSLSAARTHQRTQSLHNAESLVRYVFPADLGIVAGAGGVPVPRSDQVVASVQWHPHSGFHMGTEAYVRRLGGLVLVAPAEEGPFSADAFEIGWGHVTGLSLEITGTGVRYAWLASYAWERVRLLGETAAFVPTYAPAHVLDLGLTAHPSPTWLLKLSVRGAAGRHGTDVGGPFEWEACNVVDGGCEFAGSPTASGPLGRRTLPTYLRIDVGGRKHWHVGLRSRQSELGVFATFTNVLARSNVLAYAGVAGDQPLVPVEMRPPAPLVVGIDWRF